MKAVEMEVTRSSSSPQIHAEPQHEMTALQGCLGELYHKGSGTLKVNVPRKKKET